MRSGDFPSYRGAQGRLIRCDFLSDAVVAEIAWPEDNWACRYTYEFCAPGVQVLTEYILYQRVLDECFKHVNQQNPFYIPYSDSDALEAKVNAAWRELKFSPLYGEEARVQVGTFDAGGLLSIEVDWGKYRHIQSVQAVDFYQAKDPSTLLQILHAEVEGYIKYQNGVLHAPGTHQNKPSIRSHIPYYGGVEN
jgi:hypothetical protein